MHKKFRDNLMILASVMLIGKYLKSQQAISKFRNSKLQSSVILDTIYHNAQQHLNTQASKQVVEQLLLTITTVFQRIIFSQILSTTTAIYRLCIITFITNILQQLKQNSNKLTIIVYSNTCHQCHYFYSITIGKFNYATPNS